MLKNPFDIEEKEPKARKFPDIPIMIKTIGSARLWQIKRHSERSILEGDGYTSG
jgi:hypothetical protein